jgi:hypothetical protein
VVHVTRIEEEIITYKYSMGTSEGKGQVGRRRRRWKDNSKIYLKEIGPETMD